MKGITAWSPVIHNKMGADSYISAFSVKNISNNLSILSACELRSNSLRGALYRRAPLSGKRSTGSFSRIHPCGAPDMLGISPVATGDEGTALDLRAF